MAWSRIGRYLGLLVTTWLAVTSVVVLGSASPASAACPPGAYLDGGTCYYVPTGAYNPYAENDTYYSCALPYSTATFGATASSQCNVLTPAGSYATKQNTTVGQRVVHVLCAPGSYNPYVGATEVSPVQGCAYLAPPGRYIPGSGATSAAAALNCNPGTYAPDYGYASCPNVPAGYYSGVGAVNPTPCAAGRYSPTAGAASCTFTSPGHYMPYTGYTYQFECAAGTYSAFSGATSCTPAAAGYRTNAASAATGVVACAAGTFSTGSAVSCTTADPGHYANAPTAATAQVACAAGSYQPASGATSCLLADVDHYVPGEGATEQLACPFRTAQPATGATSCVANPDAPGLPRNVAATVGVGSAVVTWLAPTDDGGTPLTGYIVTASPGGKTVTVGPGVTTATITGLAKGTAYTFAVVATNAKGPGGSASSSAVTTPREPGAAAAPKAKVKGRSVTLSWLAPDAGGATITGYRILRDDKVVRTVAGTVLSSKLKGLSKGRHTFQIIAFNEVGDGIASLARKVRIR